VRFLGIESSSGSIGGVRALVVALDSPVVSLRLGLMRSRCGWLTVLLLPSLESALGTGNGPVPTRVQQTLSSCIRLRRISLPPMRAIFQVGEFSRYAWLLGARSVTLCRGSWSLRLFSNTGTFLHWLALQDCSVRSDAGVVAPVH